MARREQSLEQLRERHRLWLGRHGLLDRPWFVLASAPNPTIPENIADRAALVCINNAAATAARLGLPPPGLTFRNNSKEWNSVAGVKLPLVLLVSNKNRLELLWTKLLVSKSKVGELRALHKRPRDAIVAHFLGNALRDVGRMHKPSTGIFAVLYGMFVGAPAIVLGGVSMDKDGYSYGSLPGIQKHRDEDRLAMQIIAERYPAVSTSEPEVAERTGIPLYR